MRRRKIGGGWIGLLAGMAAGLFLSAFQFSGDVLAQEQISTPAPLGVRPGDPVFSLATATPIPYIPPTVAATSTPAVGACGLVEGFDYPIDISDTLERAYDDFALLRPRFGGRHVGIDIGFNRRGEPVYSAARGRVTYSDVYSWDTEKGVVIVEHTMPDMSIVYTLYGHMEVSDTVRFPDVGACVERGSIVGLVGWPSRGLPHLHYEIRNFMPDEGGPGYVVENPLLQGWYHPFDFTETWRMRFTTAYAGSVTYNEVPSLPPALVDSGIVAIASNDILVAFSGTGQPLWRVNAPDVITGIAALPGDRVAVHTRAGQAFIVQNGRFVAVWNVAGPDVPFLVNGETLIFVTDDRGLAAFSADGTPAWNVPGDSAEQESQLRVTYFEQAADGGQIALATRSTEGTRLRLISNGAVVQDVGFGGNTAFAPLPGGWLAVAGGEVSRIVPAGGDGGAGGSVAPLAELVPNAGRTARVVADAAGNTYVYLGDAENTLLSLDPAGGLRWRVAYPAARSDLAPMLAAGGGCLLYTLDATGWLNAFNTADGALLNRVRVYPGGVQNGSPRARMLEADADDRLLVGAGFLTTFALNGRALGGGAADACLPG